MELTVDIIKALSQIVVDHKLDQLKVGDLHIIKNKHEVVKSESSSITKQASLMDDEELLYWSTSAPALTAEQVMALSANPVPTAKPKRKYKDK